MKILVGLVIWFGLLFGTVDINIANEKELVSLKGIGSNKAQAIVKYREGHCFKTVQELAKVKGIGSKTVEKNLSNLTASKCK
jgi:competence protein ComEA